MTTAAGFPAFNELEKRAAFEVQLLTFEPGQAIPEHDHPNMTGVLACTTGQLTIRTYELLHNRFDALAGRYRLKRTKDVVLSPTEVSTLTASKRNIHRVQAASFCQAIDIFTPPYDSTRVAQTRWYRVHDRPIEGTQEVYDATSI